MFILIIFIAIIWVIIIKIYKQVHFISNYTDHVIQQYQDQIVITDSCYMYICTVCMLLYVVCFYVCVYIVYILYTLFFIKLTIFQNIMQYKLCTLA